MFSTRGELGAPATPLFRGASALLRGCGVGISTSVLHGEPLFLNT